LLSEAEQAVASPWRASARYRRLTFGHRGVSAQVNDSGAGGPGEPRRKLLSHPRFRRRCTLRRKSGTGGSHSEKRRAWSGDIHDYCGCGRHRRTEAEDTRK